MQDSLRTELAEGLNELRQIYSSLPGKVLVDPLVSDLVLQVRFNGVTKEKVARDLRFISAVLKQHGRGSLDTIRAARAKVGSLLGCCNA